jgi:hypothetical protein
LQRGRDLHWCTPLPAARPRDTLPGQRLQFSWLWMAMTNGQGDREKRYLATVFGPRMTVGSKCRKSPIDGGKDGGSSGRARG